MTVEPQRHAGFSLIELMIAIVIISVLASIAYPAYTDYVYKSRRSEATGPLLDLAGRMERYYADQNSYTGATVAGLLGGTGTEHGYYSLSFKALAAQSYTLRAQPAGKQADDACGTYTLASTGSRDVESGSLSKAKCW